MAGQVFQSKARSLVWDAGFFMIKEVVTGYPTNTLVGTDNEIFYPQISPITLIFILSMKSV
jgi:hypothetical protein